MVVSDYMTSNVTTLKDDAKLLDAAQLIRRTGKRHVPILSAQDRKVVGIISDRDVSRLAPSILSEQTQEEYNRIFESTPITMAMTKAPITIAPSAPIADAVQLLYAKKNGGLLVVEDTQRVDGSVIRSEYLVRITGQKFKGGAARRIPRAKTIRRLVC